MTQQFSPFEAECGAATIARPVYLSPVEHLEPYQARAGRPVGGWSGAGARGIVATVAAGGGAAFGFVAFAWGSDLIHRFSIGAPLELASDSIGALLLGGLAALIAAVVAVTVGAPADLLVGLAARTRRRWVARLLGVVAAAAVVGPIVALAPPTFAGIAAAVIPAFLLAPWVVWSTDARAQKDRR